MFSTEAGLKAFVGEPEPDPDPADPDPDPDPAPEPDPDPVVVEKPAPEPDPEPDPEPPGILDDPLSMGEQIERAKELLKQKKENPEPEPEPEPDPDPPEPDPEPDPKVAKKRVRRAKSDPLPRPTELDEKDPKPAPAPAATSWDEQVGFEVDEDTEDYLDTVRYAEESNETYKGAVGKEVKRLKKVKKWITDWESNPDNEGQLDPNDPEYRTFLAENPPALTGRDQRRLDRERIVNEAEERAERKADEKMSKFRREIDEVKIRPQIEKTINTFRDTMLGHIPEEFQEVAKEGGDALIAANPFEGDIIIASLGRSEKAASAFLELERGVTDYDKDDVYHTWVAQRIADSGEYFSEHGGKERIRSGKQFLSRAQYTQLLRKSPEAAQSKYWTFNEKEILEIIEGSFAAELDDQLVKLREKLDAGGYKRDKKNPKARSNGRGEGKEKKPAKPKEASPRIGSRPSDPNPGAPKARPFFEKHLMTSRKES